jgi:ribonuclease HI
MGFGWLFTTDLALDIKYLGSCKEWASSTKAELIAIITAMIVCPPHSSITIYTDSNNCIDMFNKLKSLKLTARRFQKMNNCTLWNTLRHIMVTLHINVSLIKVKAHLGDPHNDAADVTLSSTTLRLSTVIYEK